MCVSVVQAKHDLIHCRIHAKLYIVYICWIYTIRGMCFKMRRRICVKSTHICIHISCKNYTLDKREGGDYLSSMDAYVVCKSMGSSSMVLQAWLAPEALIDDFASFFGWTIDYIEGMTTVFKIDISLLDKFNPVLEKFYPMSSVFYSYPQVLEDTDADMHLWYWEYATYFLPLEVIPGLSDFTLVATWNYRTTPPQKNQDYLYPDNQEDGDAGDGEIYKHATSGANPFSYSLELWRWYTWQAPPPDGEYVYISQAPAWQFHYMGGDPDFSDYSINVNPDYPPYNTLVASTTPPIQPAYTGNNVWNISPEFSAAISIHNTAIGGGWVYYLDLDGGSLHIKRTALAGKPTNKGVGGGLCSIVGASLIGVLLDILGLKLWKEGE